MIVNLSETDGVYKPAETFIDPVYWSELCDALLSADFSATRSATGHVGQALRARSAIASPTSMPPLTMVHSKPVERQRTRRQVNTGWTPITCPLGPGHYTVRNILQGPVRLPPTVMITNTITASSVSTASLTSQSGASVSVRASDDGVTMTAPDIFPLPVCNCDCPTIPSCPAVSVECNEGDNNNNQSNINRPRQMEEGTGPVKMQGRRRKYRTQFWPTRLWASPTIGRSA